MEIKVIRPNAKSAVPADYKELTDKIIQSYASPGTEITIVYPEAGPNVGGWGGHLSEARVKAIAPLTVEEAVNAEVFL